MYFTDLKLTGATYTLEIDSFDLNQDQLKALGLENKEDSIGIEVLGSIYFDKHDVEVNSGIAIYGRHSLEIRPTCHMVNAIIQKFLDQGGHLQGVI